MSRPTYLLRYVSIQHPQDHLHADKSPEGWYSLDCSGTIDAFRAQLSRLNNVLSAERAHCSHPLLHVTNFRAGNA